MTAKDIAFYIGETWTIDGVVNQADGAPLDLTGATIEFRIASDSALIFKSTPADFTIANPATGTYVFNAPANDTRQAGLVPNTYAYEVSVQDGQGGVTVQNVGKVMLKKSLRTRFP